MHYIKLVRFTWDPQKAESNLRKHRVSFEEAATVFDDTLAVVHPDDVHPERNFIVGMSKKSRVLLCVYAEPQQDEIRIISARRLTRKERTDYEEDR
jgi:uncharacterized DUF497 family protein